MKLTEEQKAKIAAHLLFLYENARETDDFTLDIIKYKNRDETTIISKRFNVRDVDAAVEYLANELEKYNEKDIKGIYSSVNAVKAGGEGRIKSDEVEQVINIAIDYDLFHNRENMINRINKQLTKSAFETACDTYLKKYKYRLLWTGRGYSLFIKIKPLKVPNNPEERMKFKEIFKEVCKEIALKILREARENADESVKTFFSDDVIDTKVFDLARIMRIDQSVNTFYISNIDVIENAELVKENVVGEYLDIRDYIEEAIAREEKITVVEKRARKLKENEIEELVEYVSKYWVEGRRHYLALALSGYLYWRKVAKEQVKEIITKICQVANDEDLKDRLTCVETTYSRENYVAYKTFLKEAFKNEDEIMKFIMNLNRILKNYISASTIRVNKSERAFFRVEELKKEGALLNFLVESTLAAYRNIQEGKDAKGVKVIVELTMNNQTHEVDITKIVNADKKALIELNKTIKMYFKKNIYDTAEFDKLSKEEKDEILYTTMHDIEDYFYYVVDIAEDIVSEDDEDVETAIADFFNSTISKSFKDFVYVEDFDKIDTVLRKALLESGYAIIEQGKLDDTVYVLWQKLRDYIREHVEKISTQKIMKIMKKNKLVRKSRLEDVRDTVIDPLETRRAGKRRNLEVIRMSWFGLESFLRKKRVKIEKVYRIEEVLMYDKQLRSSYEELLNMIRKYDEEKKRNEQGEEREEEKKPKYSVDVIDELLGSVETEEEVIAE